MAIHSIEADYLIVGCGAVGMAFADVLLKETSATIVMVDRHHRPGGHWNDAYPFVRLHGPSSQYGVPSRQLGQGTRDTMGLNQGLDELASGPELLNYFDQVMQTLFLPSGRVRYFPMCHYSGDGEFTSLLSGDTYRLKVHKKVVDATFTMTDVPSMHQPAFKVAPDVDCVPPNDLPRVTKPHGAYAVIGAGKTAIDTCLWLLANGVAPDAIRWIRPRDAWLQDRANMQTGDDAFEQSFGGIVKQLEAIVAADSIGDLFDRLEAAGQLLRIDESVRPTMYRGAIVSRAELDELRKIRHVVRMGHVQSITSHQLVLERGTLSTGPDWLYIDCSADGLKKRQPQPVFAGSTITPQWVDIFQPTFSAAFVAHVEASYPDDDTKNRLCGVVAGSDQDVDWLRMWAVSLANNFRWSKDQALLDWKAQCRTDIYTAVVRRVRAAQPEKLALLARYGASAGPAAAKLKLLLAEVP